MAVAIHVAKGGGSVYFSLSREMLANPVLPVKPRVF